MARTIKQLRTDQLLRTQEDQRDILDLRQQAETRVLDTGIALEDAQNAHEQALRDQQDVNAQIAKYLGLSVVSPAPRPVQPPVQPLVRPAQPPAPPIKVKVSAQRLADLKVGLDGDGNEPDVDAVEVALSAIEADGFALNGEIRKSLGVLRNPPQVGPFWNRQPDWNAVANAAEDLENAVKALEK